MIVVLDTSVLFAAFAFPKGVCAQVFRGVLAKHQSATSDFILDELADILERKTTLNAADIEEARAIVRQASLCVEPATVPPDACRDPNDAAILGTAVAAGAEVLVSGDKDLLVLQRFGSISILTPRQLHDCITSVS